MLKAIILAATLALGTGLAAQAAECQRPAKIKIPDPNKAEAKDFDRAYADLNKYHKSVTDYNACLQKEASDAGAEYTAAAQDYEKAVKAYNGNVEKANKSQ